MLDGEEAGVPEQSGVPRPPRYWPSGGEGEDSAGEASPALSGDGEALVVGSSYSSWDIPAAQGSSQEIEEGDE